MRKLKRCPFCGKKMKNSFKTVYEKDWYGEWVVECPKCAASVSGKDPDEVIDKWNTRVEPKDKPTIQQSTPRINLELPSDMADTVVVDGLTDAYNDIQSMIDSLMQYSKLDGFRTESLKEYNYYKNAINIVLEYFGGKV